MQYIHVKNIEKYNPGYSDRNLIWCKIYFGMLNTSYTFDQIDDIDKWRLIALIMLELQMKKPIPYDEHWLLKKISNSKRPISLTLQMLHNFVELVTLDGEQVYPRVEKNRVEKNRVEKNSVCVTLLKRDTQKIKKYFEQIWARYPKRVGKKQAFRHFKASIGKLKDWENINKALDNYLKTKDVKAGYIKNGYKFFNNWQDYVDYEDPTAKQDEMEEYRKKMGLKNK